MTSDTVCYPAPEVNGFMLTRSGTLFDLMRPDVAMVSFPDIAHALANICRYGGHSRRFYSVAEHSSHLASWFLDQGDRPNARWALLHDAPEAYTGDIIAPIKRGIGPWYSGVERMVERVVFSRAGLLPEGVPMAAQPIPHAVKVADQRIRTDEIKALFPGDLPQPYRALGVNILGLAPLDACRLFTMMGRELFGANLFPLPPEATE